MITSSSRRTYGWKDWSTDVRRFSCCVFKRMMSRGTLFAPTKKTKTDDSAVSRLSSRILNIFFFALFFAEGTHRHTHADGNVQIPDSCLTDDREGCERQISTKRLHKLFSWKKQMTTRGREREKRSRLLVLSVGSFFLPLMQIHASVHEEEETECWRKDLSHKHVSHLQESCCSQPVLMAIS